MPGKNGQQGKRVHPPGHIHSQLRNDWAEGNDRSAVWIEFVILTTPFGLFRTVNCVRELTVTMVGFWRPFRRSQTLYMYPPALSHESWQTRRLQRIVFPALWSAIFQVGILWSAPILWIFVLVSTILSIFTWFFRSVWFFAENHVWMLMIEGSSGGFRV